jgi:chorismate synthase
VGGVIDGFPANVEIDVDFIQSELNRRRPGQSDYVSKRNETDKIEILSGIFNGKSLGTPIGFVVRNNDKKPDDYNHLKDVYRPSHADYTYHMKYGIRDYRGGGRSSARETLARVVGGAFAKILLAEKGIRLTAFVDSLGGIATKKNYQQQDFSLIAKSAIRCPEPETERLMLDLIEKTAAEGDTLGGTIFCVVQGVPAGIGEPVFGKLNSQLAGAMLSINAAKGFEIGSGFKMAKMKGSESNDVFQSTKDGITTTSNHSGGVQGGISNGEDIYFRVAFKPVASLMQDQKTVDSKGNEVLLKGKGRHDVSVIPRAVPIVEAMAALTVVDLMMQFNRW